MKNRIQLLKSVLISFSCSHSDQKILICVIYLEIVNIYIRIWLTFLFFKFSESAVVVALAEKALPSILLLTRINVLYTILKNSTTLVSMRCPWMWPTSSKKRRKEVFFVKSISRKKSKLTQRPLSYICLYKSRNLIYYYYYNKFIQIFAAASQRWLWRFLFSRKKEELLNWKIMCFAY